MQTARPIQLLRSAPYFPVADVDLSVADYARTLGFHVEYSAGSPTQFAIVRRDGLAIMLRRVADASCIRPNERQGGTWDVFFWVHGLASLFAELSARGADIVYGPTVQDAYRMEEFAVRDGDGHVLGFGEQLTPSPAN